MSALESGRIGAGTGDPVLLTFYAVNPRARADMIANG
jgi:siroheme synthase